MIASRLHLSTVTAFLQIPAQPLMQIRCSGNVGNINEKYVKGNQEKKF